MKNWLSFIGVLFFLGQFPLFAQIHEERSAMDEKTKKQLIQYAVEASQKAYAPYSHYFVGAALLTKEGDIFQGCNVENASYGLACCAERVTIFKAVSEGKKDFIALAVVTRDGGFPCGACRQVLNEFNPNLIILIGDQMGRLMGETSLSALLPDAFGSQNLQK